MNSADLQSSTELKTILFVEDEDFLRTVISEVLTNAGYRVLTASNGLEALSVRAQFAGPLDLLLTDFCMPLKNGEDLALELMALEPGLKTIFTSGYGDIRETGEAIPHITFLPKPFSIKTLIRKIHETIDTDDPAAANAQPALSDDFHSQPVLAAAAS
jgi:two-component system cell cycle sensor histidine kinase/response regulator CckA